MQAHARQKQQRCHTDAVHQVLANNYFGLSHTKQRDRLQQKIKKQAAKFRTFKNNTSTGEIVIPVAFHIVYNQSVDKIPRSKVIEQLSILNDAFKGNDPDFAAQTPSR